jgi:hypothetical protein
MRRFLIAATLVGALVYAGAASAGCMATVGLAPPPAGIAPGTTWTAEMRILQHGERALPNAATAQPQLTIVNAETGDRQAFVAQPTADPEVFAAAVVFPSAGTWRYEVFDGFTSVDGQAVPCARTHTFAAVDVGGPGTAGGGAPPSPPAASGEEAGFPIVPAVGATLAVLAALALSVALVRRRRGEVATG